MPDLWLLDPVTLDPIMRVRDSCPEPFHKAVRKNMYVPAHTFRGKRLPARVSNSYRVHLCAANISKALGEAAGRRLSEGGDDESTSVQLFFQTAPTAVAAWASGGAGPNATEYHIFKSVPGTSLSVGVVGSSSRSVAATAVSVQPGAVERRSSPGVFQGCARATGAARRRGGGELRAAPVHLQSVRIALKRGARDLNHQAQPAANWNIAP